MTRYIDYYESPLGTMQICQENDAITSLSISCASSLKKDADSFSQKTTALTEAAKKQLTEYFEGKRQIFALPLQPAGTPFQKQVWQALCTIPFGETRSYKEIALLINNPKGCRAVGMANHRNPIMLLIPCHRVIGSSGALVGYAGGLHIKKWLLDHESRHMR